MTGDCLSEKGTRHSISPICSKFPPSKCPYFLIQPGLCLWESRENKMRLSTGMGYKEAVWTWTSFSKQNDLYLWKAASLWLSSSSMSLLKWEKALAAFQMVQLTLVQCFAVPAKLFLGVELVSSNTSVSWCPVQIRQYNVQNNGWHLMVSYLRIACCYRGKMCVHAIDEFKLL